MVKYKVKLSANSEFISNYKIKKKQKKKTGLGKFTDKVIIFNLLLNKKIID